MYMDNEYRSHMIKTNLTVKLLRKKITEVS